VSNMNCSSLSKIDRDRYKKGEDHFMIFPFLLLLFVLLLIPA